MADMRNRTPFYGAVPTSKLNADHVFMADGSTAEEAITNLQNKTSRKFELIETITLTEGVNLIVRESTPDNKPYTLKSVIVTIDGTPTTTGNLELTLNNYNYGWYIPGALKTTNSYTTLTAIDVDGFKLPINLSGTAITDNSNVVGRSGLDWSSLNPIDVIEKISIKTNSTIATGSVIKIYGLWI